MTEHVEGGSPNIGEPGRSRRPAWRYSARFTTVAWVLGTALLVRSGFLVDYYLRRADGSPHPYPAAAILQFSIGFTIACGLLFFMLLAHNEAPHLCLLLGAACFLGFGFVGALALMHAPPYFVAFVFNFLLIIGLALLLTLVVSAARNARPLLAAALTASAEARSHLLASPSTLRWAKATLTARYQQWLRTIGAQP